MAILGMALRVMRGGYGYRYEKSRMLVSKHPPYIGGMDILDIWAAVQKSKEQCVGHFGHPINLCRHPSVQREPRKFSPSATVRASHPVQNVVNHHLGNAGHINDRLIKPWLAARGSTGVRVKA